MVEHCIQRSQHNQVIFCPQHGNLGPYFIASADGLVHAAHAAPDLVRTTTSTISLTACDVNVLGFHADNTIITVFYYSLH